MTVMNFHKYRPFAAVGITGRKWPDRTIAKAPVWCSVDLRDGNQALVEPMGDQRKRRLFDELLRIGFKEIEVGFPAASETDFAFVRSIIEGGAIPEDVTIQVLTQARPELIDRTFEAIEGARRAIVHLYNSTSEVQRRVVFGTDAAGVAAIATDGARRIRDHAERINGTEIVYQYSPESFTGTELDVAVEVCEAVMEVYRPTPERKMILNLPATVEMASPNVFADQIEWFGRTIRNRDGVILSLHPHNDRGSAVAAAELALMAGADRVEGTLFGNGERTGNVDIVTLAMNLFSQGVDPGLDLSDMARIVEVAESCTRLPVHPRHPYAGELVYTAFSGSHQDAIRKGMAARRGRNDPVWEVPYLPIDPADVGRSYEAVVRINSQSGKGGIAYVLEHFHGYVLPRALQVEVGRKVQEVTDRSEAELEPAEIRDLFEAEYLAAPGPVALGAVATTRGPGPGGTVALQGTVTLDGTERMISGQGNGPIAAFVDGIAAALGRAIEIVDYSEHAIGAGATAEAASYVRLRVDGGPETNGVGRNPDIVLASLEAVVSALNRAIAD